MLIKQQEESALFPHDGQQVPSSAGTPDPFWIAAGDGGIYTGKLETKCGTVTSLRLVVETAPLHATYIVKHPTKPLMYAAIRTPERSQIVVYHIQNNGELVFYSRLDDRPAGAAHMTISNDGTLLAVAYYISGKAGVYHLDPEGQIDTVCAEVSHTGHSIHPKRQGSPHPHWVGFCQKDKFLYVPDLGTDQIWIYQLNHQTPPQLTLLQKAPAPQGTGPRHMAFHPTLNLVYVSHELQPRISRYTCDPHTGKLTYLDRINALPKSSHMQEHTVSDIRLHPSGNYLYLLNRGVAEISVFAIHGTTGALTWLAAEPAHSSSARHLIFDPTGRWALVVGEFSQTFTVFAVNQRTGRLQFTHQLPFESNLMATVIA